SDADVVQHAVVTAHDEEGFVRHRAGPLEHAVDETRIAGAGDGNHMSHQDESNGEENDEGLHGAPPAPRLRKENARAVRQRNRGGGAHERVSVSSFLLAYAGRRKKFPHTAGTQVVYNRRPWSSTARRCSSSRTTTTPARSCARCSSCAAPRCSSPSRRKRASTRT